MKYEDLDFIIPVESPTYKDDSDFVVSQIKGMLDNRMNVGDDKIILNTNLKSGLPAENINKIAGPMIEAWAGEAFETIIDSHRNSFCLTSVETQSRLGMADIILQFRKKQRILTGNVDVKATAEDIANSGKSPNITSFARIRSAYVNDPGYMFIILSIKHKVYSTRDEETRMIDGIMEIKSYSVYDLKYISDNDLSYNPALGSGQIQIRDIHNVSYQYRTTWEMCQMLDRKYLNSSKRTFEDFYEEAIKHRWIRK